MHEPGRLDELSQLRLAGRFWSFPPVGRSGRGTGAGPTTGTDRHEVYREISDRSRSVPHGGDCLRSVITWWRPSLAGLGLVIGFSGTGIINWLLMCTEERRAGGKNVSSDDSSTFARLQVTGYHFFQTIFPRGVRLTRNVLDVHIESYRGCGAVLSYICSV